MAAASASPHIAIIGAGIIGVSTGLRILQEIPNSKVTIFAESISPNTTGDVAAGLWTPYCLSETPASVSDPWAAETFKFLKKFLDETGNPPETGVMYCPGYNVYRKEDPPEITWSHVPIGFRRMTNSELSMFPSDIKSGHFYVTIMAEGRKFIPKLMERFFKLGGHIVANRKILNFNELISEGFRRIVNCSGLGARELCNDTKLKPVRGQVFRVDAPWMNFWIVDDRGAYCLPNSDTVVVGGVTQSDNWNREATEEDRLDILERAFRMWPQLRSAKILRESVGLRPGRSAVRVEREMMEEAECVVYHNYGHGGAGLTLFWGCAGDITRLLREDLAIGRPKL